MRHSISLPLFALLAAGVPRLSAQGISTTPGVDSAGIAVVRNSYMKLFASADAAGLSGLFAPNGTIDQFGAPRMKGRAEIEAGFKAAFGMQQPKSLEIVPLRLTPATASLAAEIGTYHQMDTLKGKTVHAWGRYVVSLTKDSTGTWRLGYLMGFPDSVKTDK
jgi:ketosteroid isomerase-like protein